MRRFLFIIATLFTLAAHAQSIQGTVTDAATGLPLFAVTVVNEKTQQGTTTDQNGFYVLAANTGETIAYTYIGYKTEERVKPMAVIITTMDIKLQPTNTQLKEFVFHGDRRSKYQIDSAERKVIYHTVLSRRPPSPFNSPVSAIAELFSKKAKMAYEFQKAYVVDEENRFIDTRYTPSLVTKLTGLTGDSMAHFMYAYPMPIMYAREASDLELKMWIRDSYREWIKHAAITDTTRKK